CGEQVFSIFAKRNLTYLISVENACKLATIWQGPNSRGLIFASRNQVFTIRAEVGVINTTWVVVFGRGSRRMRDLQKLSQNLSTRCSLPNLRGIVAGAICNKKFAVWAECNTLYSIFLSDTTNLLSTVRFKQMRF